MFEHALVYNPDLGTEEDIDPQLVCTWPLGDTAPPQSEFVRLVGVAQGIAELAYSFGESPVRWFKSGTGAAAKLTLVVPIWPASDDPQKWRSGLWLAAQLPVPRGAFSWLTPQMVYSVVVQTFTQHRLTHGPVPSSQDPRQNYSGPRVAREAGDAYWSAFIVLAGEALLSPAAVAMLAVAPHAVRMAPGTLSPTTAAAIEAAGGRYGAEVLICTRDDGAAVYPGRRLGVETRRAALRWLAKQNQGTHAVGAGSANVGDVGEAPSVAGVEAGEGRKESGEGSAGNGEAGDVEASNEEARNEEAGDEAGEAGNKDTGVNRLATPSAADTPSAVAGAAPPSPARSTHSVAPSVAPSVTPSVAPSVAPSTRSAQPSSWLSFSVPGLQSLSSLAVPAVSLSMPSMPSMPSVSMPSVSMPSVSMPSMPSMSMGTQLWWSSKPVDEVVDGYVAEGAELFDLEDGTKLRAWVWRQAMYVYMVMYPVKGGEPGEPAEQGSESSEPNQTEVDALLDTLSGHMEGFSFAFAPPTPFHYLILDHHRHTMVSTFPFSAETLGSLTELEAVDTPQVVRLGATWLYFTGIEKLGSGSARAVFGKKSTAQQTTTLLGAFQQDVHGWLRDYLARGVLDPMQG